MTPLIIQDQFGIIQNLQTSPISQISFLVGTFFVTSYSKIAVIFKTELINSKFVKKHEEDFFQILRTNLISFRTFRCPLFPKPFSWLGLFCCFLQQDGSNAIHNYFLLTYFDQKKYVFKQTFTGYTYFT